MRAAARLAVAVVLAAACGAAACTSGGAGPTAAPAGLLSATVPTGPAAAGTSWPVFAGGTDNTRFSARTQINAGNVARLGVAWSAPLGPFATLAESYPVMVGRTPYLTTSTDEVQPYDAATGARIWSYAPQVDFTLSRGVGGYGVTVNRSVAVSGGKVYLLTFDDRLRAAGRATGEELWTTTIADAHTGAHETSAPTALNGLIFGGDFGSPTIDTSTGMLYAGTGRLAEHPHPRAGRGPHRHDPAVRPVPRVPDRLPPDRPHLALTSDIAQRRTRAMPDITLQQAQSVLDAALKRAAETGTPMDIAVADTGGNLKAFARMDGGRLGSIDGTIGVSDSTVENDHAVAAASAHAI
jgi:hypothetical protein